MGRWLAKSTREERDEKVIELYQSGLPYSVIIQRLGLSSNGAICTILNKYGVVRNRIRKRGKQCQR